MLTGIPQDKCVHISACKSVTVIHRNLSTDDLSVGVPVWSSSEQGSILGSESTFCSRELEKGVRVGLLPHMKFILHRLLYSYSSHAPNYMYKTLNVLVFDSSFAPLLKVLCYKGDKARRAEIQTEIKSHEFHVLLTTYEVSGLCNDKSLIFYSTEH